jgi:hypothetical protein
MIDIMQIVASSTQLLLFGGATIKCPPVGICEVLPVATHRPTPRRCHRGHHPAPERGTQRRALLQRQKLALTQWHAQEFRQSCHFSVEVLCEALIAHDVVALRPQRSPKSAHIRVIAKIAATPKPVVVVLNLVSPDIQRGY